VAHEKLRKGFGGGLGDGLAEDKAGEVAHSCHEVSVKAFKFHVKIRYATGLPKIDV